VKGFLPMAIRTITPQVPVYRDPNELGVDFSKYGQPGGTLSHNFFDWKPGEPYTFKDFEPGSQNPPSSNIDIPEPPGMAQSLISALATKAAGDVGANAGKAAYDYQFNNSGQSLDLGQQISQGFNRTVDQYGNFIGDTAQGVSNLFGGAAPAAAPAAPASSWGAPVQMGPNMGPDLSTGPNPLGGYIQAQGGTVPSSPAATGALGDLSQLDTGDPSGGSMANSVFSNIGSPIWDGGKFADNLKYGGWQSGLLSGGVTLGLGLLSGGSFEDSAKKAITTGVGTAVGYAVAGSIGGFIGGAISSVFDW